MQYCSSVRSPSPLLYQRKHLSDVPDVGAFLVSVVHRGPEPCRPEPLLATQKCDPFTALILLGDMLDALSVSRVPHRHWDLFASSARRRRADAKRPEERYPLEIVSLSSPLPDGTTRKERLLRCCVTAYILVGAVVQTPFFTLRTDADDTCARPISAMRLPLRRVHRHACTKAMSCDVGTRLAEHHPQGLCFAHGRSLLDHRLV